MKAACPINQAPRCLRRQQRVLWFVVFAVIEVCTQIQVAMAGWWMQEFSSRHGWLVDAEEKAKKRKEELLGTFITASGPRLVLVLVSVQAG